ncbi:RNA polymerase sigma factor [Thermodesulfitimonas autotrophica]|uniref:RNA polymerase sigma factor n=1 Tax=Thermodesulfitimonas autotrophica TaxID=1894989 RepID=UPI002FDF7AEC
MRLKPPGKKEVKLLFERFAQRVFETAYFVLRDRTLAEDVVQETFLTAMTKLGNLRDPLKVEAWLVRVTVNKARSELRKRKRSSPCLSPPAFASLTEEALLVSEEKMRLQAALEALPGKY